MKIATWNVNSLKVRLPQLLDWAQAARPDVICLQETKCEDANFPREALEAAGYHAAFSGQKTYNGVAILSRRPLLDPAHGIAGHDDPQRRVVAATVDGVRVLSVYVPNGQSVGSDKYAYKLAWLDKLREWLAEELRQHPRMAILGDYNIAPEDRDVHDPKAWAGSVLVSEPERQRFRALLDLGLVDSFRLFDQPPGTYSWWDYRLNAFKRNLGLRIDHILLSSPLAPCCVSCAVDKAPRGNERPSDHTPVMAELQLSDRP